ncbi:hypothetical protein [Cytobacillus sp.]|uniref:hypothetical protein n=1 Tax=Cytobacillus sp. TaxID=2675269 RepID=UPI0028BE3DB8|nr:hypothetical protein [Cytobacillus sp.]
MKKFLFSAFSPLLWIPLGIVVYLSYIHLISWLSYPIGAVVVIFFGLAIICWLFFFMKDVIYFVKRLFKDDNTRDEKGFKKHF